MFAGDTNALICNNNNNNNFKQMFSSVVSYISKWFHAFS